MKGAKVVVDGFSRRDEITAKTEDNSTRIYVILLASFSPFSRDLDQSQGDKSGATCGLFISL